MTSTDRPMNSHTQTRVFSATKEAVFAFLSDIQNLPKWATGFAKEMKRVDGKHKVVTPQGEMFFRLDSNESTGIVDMFAGPAEDQMACFPSRVIALPGGNSAYTFTNFQWPGIPDDVFAVQNETLDEEFEVLAKQVESNA